MCIGNTLPARIIGIADPVYPYVYREHSFMLPRKIDIRGLSLCV